MIWPERPGSWNYGAREAQKAFVKVAEAIGESEKVYMLVSSSGVYYMDTIADSLQGGGTVTLNDGGAASFDPQLIVPNEELIIVVDGVQGRFRTTNWYITAVVTLLSGILAYFVSGRALKPLRSFASQVEQVLDTMFGS